MGGGERLRPEKVVGKMSAIFGLFYRDGRPVTPAALDTMRAAIAPWGPNSGGVWLDGPAGRGAPEIRTPERQRGRRAGRWFMFVIDAQAGS